VLAVQSHILSTHKGVLDNINICQNCLDEPSLCLESVVCVFFVQACHDSIVNGVSPVCIVETELVESVDIHRCIFSVLLSLTIMTMNRAPDTNLLLWFAVLGLLDSPHFVVITNSCAHLVVVLNEWVLAIKLDLF